MNHFCFLLVSILIELNWSSTKAWAQHSDRLGLSPADRKRFDETVATGDFYLYLGIGSIVVGVVIFLAGMVYYYSKKKKAKE